MIEVIFLGYSAWNQGQVREQMINGQMLSCFKAFALSQQQSKTVNVA
jgi:putative AlgH/UPF0301 family transcriptional regulator